MATKKIKVETGEGLPNESTKGDFYKDISTDKLYQRIDGDWVEQIVIPAKAGIIYGAY